MPTGMAPPAHFSVSRQIDARFNRRRPIRLAMAAVYVIGTLFYLAWRITIFNSDSLLVSLAFYAAEWIGFILGLTVIFSAWRYTHREPGQVPPGLSVDVLIPTYKEPLHIIRRTLMAARDIRYPHQTWVLDDANRPEIEALARDLGVRYLSRRFNENAKAGNLNNGLSHSRANFVAVFDADHIAQPHALDTLLGLMQDERIAMVQTPQDYYNTDAFQYLSPRRKAGLWHDQSYFYNLAQACRDGWNASSCVGTGVLYRRAALDSIGGIPVDTVTEDFHTSLKLHKQGWQTRYLNEPVAFGVAAADLGEYYKTRHRWAHGNLATLRVEHIFSCAGLTLKQRLSYLSLGLIYLEGWQQLLLFLIPLCALMLGWAPFQISLFNVLIVLCFPIIGYLLLQEFGCGFSRFWTNEVFAMARWPIHLVSAAALFGRKLPWRSSTKNIQGEVNWRLMVPQLTIFALGALALVYAAWRLNEDFVVGPLAHALFALLAATKVEPEALFEILPAGYSAELVAIAGFWALFNMVRAGAFVAKALSNARRSNAFFRFELPLPVSLASQPTLAAQTVSISEEWVQLATSSLPDTSSGELQLTLHLPDGPLTCDIAIVRQKAGNLEGNFLWESEAQRDRLAATLYSIGWQRELQHHHAYFLTPSDLISYLFGQKPDGAEPKRQWIAGLLPKYNNTQDAMPILISRSASFQRSPQYIEIISFSTLSIGLVLEILLPDVPSKSICLKPVRELPIASLPHSGLNGRSFWRYQAELH